jgi:hypothetical protein
MKSRHRPAAIVLAPAGGDIRPLCGYVQRSKRLWCSSGMADVADSHRRKSLGPARPLMRFSLDGTAPAPPAAGAFSWDCAAFAWDCAAFADDAAFSPMDF